MALEMERLWHWRAILSRMRTRNAIAIAVLFVYAVIMTAMFIHHRRTDPQIMLWCWQDGDTTLIAKASDRNAPVTSVSVTGGPWVEVSGGSCTEKDAYTVAVKPD